MFKTCTICLETKPADDFHRRGDGTRKPHCKECQHASQRNYRIRTEIQHQETNELLQRWGRAINGSLG